MKNKDLILSTLKELSADSDSNGKYTAEEIALLLALRRNVVSHHLNELCEEGKVIKTNSRPVYFMDKEYYTKRDNIPEPDKKAMDKPLMTTTDDDPFKKLIGYDESLKVQVEQCKSSVMYPPKGLPILLEGDSGVGKSFIAQIIFDYAVKTGVIGKEAPYVIFNCAEYANNPELLSANLFGYAKGTFTGADKDKPGLLEESDNGYLFLDEVHRLPAEGQEKLFLFLDRGIYRRLGEIGKWRTSNVRFIFATTENPERTLLKTFLRRIPLIVNIPSLSERPIHERQKLVYHFYKGEASGINRDISVSPRVLNVLLRGKMSGNIGKMLNIIKYSCAHAYNQQINSSSKALMIHLCHLSNDISFDINSDEKNAAYSNGMYISQSKDDEYYDMSSNYCKQLSSITDKIIDLFDKYRNGEHDLENLNSNSLEYLNEFTNKIIFRDDEYKTYPVYLDNISKVLESCLNTLKKNYGIKFNDNTKQVLAYLINYFQGNNLPVSSDCKTNVEMTLKIIQSVYPKEYIIASKMQSYISTSMDASFDNILTIYLALYTRDLTCKDNINEITALIAARGYSTANSIASTVNKLLKHFIFDYIDLPPDCSSQHVAEKVLEYIENFGTLKKVIVLVDIDSLEVIYNLLSTRCESEVGIISSITTQLALDVGKRIIIGQPIMQIISETSIKNSVIYNLVKPVRAKKNAIITTCSTGIGTAIKIKDLLKKCLGDNIEVLAYDFNQLKLHGINDDIFHEYNIKLIIGTSDPEIDTIPYLSLENLIAGNGESVFNNLLKDFAEGKIFDQINKELVNIFSLQNVLNYLTILNPDKIFGQVDKAISGLELVMRIKFTNDLKISLYIHICCMIERLIVKDPLLSYKGLNNFEQCHKQFIELFKSSFSIIEDIYRTEIPVSEIAFIYDIIEEKLRGLSTINY